MPIETTARGWNYQLTVFRPDETLAIAIDLTDDQAAAIHAALKPDLEDPEWIVGEYIVPDVYIGTVRHV